MIIELEFLKLDNNTFWGFTLTGGAEYDFPLTVTKIDRNSIAENVGLQINDVIVKINNTPTASLTHAETNNLLIVAGNNLILTIERDDSLPSTILENDETINEEVSQILQNTYNNKLNFQLEEKTENEIISQKQQIQKHQQKWSTFLQKPVNNLPIKKQKNETLQGDTYKVVIKKQKKKIKIPYIEVQEAENVEQLDSSEIETNLKSEIVEDEHQIESVKSEELDEPKIEFQEKESEEEREELKELEEREDSAERSLSKEVESVDESLLAEQLADIQKKLQALSQLPSTYKETLNLLTENLNSIIGTKPSEDEEQIEENLNTDNEIVNEQSVTEDEVSYIKDETEEMEEIEEKCDGNETDDNEECQKVLEEIEEEVSSEETEAMERERQQREKEEKDDEEKKAEFIQRRLEQRPTLPLKPKSINRPIILPGGRRWLQPDDVCSTARGPKMTDEKIANTIETYTETLVGKTKGLTIGTEFGPGPTRTSSFSGIVCRHLQDRNSWLDLFLVLGIFRINFLKYQPPPKNLDYLQKSEVYKIIHDLEPPTRGIGIRESRILAEEDYYGQG